MTDFLFHEVSEKEREEIKAEAKNIMDSFSKKLAKVEKKISEPLIERDDFERAEKNSSELDEDFRKRVFDNAPMKNKDFLIAEKKGW